MPLRDHRVTARPALLGDKAESIPFGLEDPLFVVEGFVDKRRQHRSISGIHAFSSAERIVYTSPSDFAP
jgi:hypothetical protein